MIRETAGGIDLDVRVIPRARHTSVVGERDGALLVRLAAPPVDDAANAALVAFLSELFHTPRSAIRIVSGARHRRKRVAIAGLKAADARARVTAALERA